MTFVYAVAFADDMFVMVRNRSRAWEMPGGKVNPGEKPEESVKREFFEETGMKLIPVSSTKIPSGIVFFGRADPPSEWPWPPSLKGKSLHERSRLSGLPLDRPANISEEISDVALFEQLPEELSFSRKEYEAMLQEARSAVKKYINRNSIGDSCAIRTIARGDE